MAGPRFRFLAVLAAVLAVLALLGSASATASAATPAAKTKAAAKSPSPVVRHRGSRVASVRAAEQRAKRPLGPLADGALGSENVALAPIASHVKHVAQRKTLSASALSNGKVRHSVRAGISPALDSQFPGLDLNNDDSDPLNLGNDFSADTDGAVGPHYYGEVVGSAYGFFDKSTGALVADDTLVDLFDGSGVGTGCEAPNDDGYYEPHILYDSQSGRWIVMVSAEQNPDTASAAGFTYECIAVSASGDPVNGNWYFYSVPLVGGGALDVYGSAAGVWTDGIYFSETIGCQDENSLCPGYNGNEGLVGTQVWDFNRSDLESGAALRVQTTQGLGGIGSGNFQGPRTTTTFSNLDADGLVPANLETMTGVPPAGRNEYFVSMSDLPGSGATPLGDGLMDIWQYHVDWSNPSNSWIGQSATSQIDYQVTTPTYGVPDFSSGEIPTAGPTAYANPLYTNYDYILPKPQYTDFGGVESLWTAHATSTCSGSCNANSTTGPDRVRWNQISLNSSDGSPVTTGPAQGQDYAPSPTTLSRWLPAIAVDQSGDMAVGYSGTSPTVLPSLYIAGRSNSDPANTLTSLPETEVYAGDGYQTGSIDGTADGFFGPENSMSLDPNGCELWFAGQVDVGSPNSPTGDDDAWSTEVSSFHFPGCTPSTLATALTTSADADTATNTATLTATLTATGTGSGVAGEVVDFTLGGTSVGTATTDSDGVATLTGVDSSAYVAGSYSGAVGATYAGDPTYNYGSSSAGGTLLAGSAQTISFGSLSDQTYGNGPFTINATASSSLPVTFSTIGDTGTTDSDGYGVDDSGTCSVSGTTVTITGAGSCTIVASQSGDGSTWLPAAPVSQTFNIAQETQSINVTGTWASTNQTVGTDFQATATSSSGGQVFFTSDETNCTEVDNGDTPQDEFVPLHVGTCTIYAEQDGTTDIAQVIQPVNVTITGMGSQTGTFAVTSSSRRVDQLQNTPDDVTWSSGLTDSTYTTSGTVTVASVAASAALTVSGAATPVAITKATESGTTVTITVGTNPFSTGNSVVIAGISPSGYNGTYTVTKPSGMAGNTTFTYTDTAGLTTPATSVTGATATLASSGATESGNTVTITTTASNAGKLAAGDTVSVVGVGLSGYNGNYTIATVPTSTTFTYTDATSGLAASGGGTVGDTAITGASESGTTVTLNLTAAPTSPIGVGSSITVASVSPTTYNGTWTVTAVPTITSLQYTDSTSGIAAGGAGSVNVAGTSCTASGPLGSKTLTALHAGTCTVTATQAGDADYIPGSVSKTYTITAGTQSDTWSPAGGNISASSPTSVSVTTNSGLSPGTVTSTTTATCTVGSTSTTGGTSTVTVSPGTPGTCTLSASGNSGSLDWSTLGAKTQNFTVTNAGTAQTITFTAPPPQSLAVTPVALSATATSGLPVSFNSSTTSVCTTTGSNGTTLNLLTSGTCTIVASQLGNGTYAPATNVTQSFSVNTADQLIEFAQLPDVTYGTAPFAVTATSVNAYYPEEVPSGTATGLSVSYSAAGSCTVNGGGTVTVTGAGTCTITASQAGNSVYNPAGSIANQFTVDQASSSITFTNPGSMAYGSPNFNPGATSSSGEAVTYTATGSCTITGGGLVHLTGVGTCNVTAHSVGDANYAPPAAVLESFSVTAGSSSTTSTPGSSSIVLGSSNTDGAVVTGGGAAPTGTVTFYECGATASPQPCTSQANEVGTAVTLTPGGGGSSTAQSVSFTPAGSGYYCFGAYYSGDSNYSASSDTSTDECFDVAAASSSTTSTPTHSSIVLGDNNTDGAVVTGNADGGSPTGTVTFYECGATATPQACTSQTNQVGTAVTLTAGADDTSSANSVTFAPDTTGYYCFGAYYSGDSNYSASSDTSTGECFDVTSATSGTTSSPASSSVGAGSTNTDNASVAGNSAGGAPGGTVTFYECGPTSNPAPCTSQANEVGSAVTLTAGAGDVSYASSVSVTPDSTGYYCFGAYYSGDSNYSASSDTSTDECFDVTTATSSTTSTPTSLDILLGNSNTDGAVVTGNSAVGAPTGTVTFYECGATPNRSPCTSQAHQVGTPVNVTTGAGDTSSAESGSFTPADPGYYCFGAYYSGDSNYAASSDTSTDECFDVGVSASSTTSNPTHSSIVLGNTNSDGAVVTGNATGGSPTGTVTFYVCQPTASPTPCSSQTNQVGSPVNVTAGSGHQSTAHSATFTPTSTGYWCFGAYYSGDSNYEGSTDTSTDECFDVTAASSTTTSLPSSTRIGIGHANTDNVTVAGNTAGGAPSGTVTFYECGPTASPAPCTSKANPVGSAVTLAPGAGDVSYASSLSTTFNSAGTYCFGAYYSGDSNYSASSDTTTTECFVVQGAPTITSFSPAAGAPGITVTIIGTNLTRASKVTFGGVAGVITSNSATKIKVKVPVGAKTGKIKVQTVAGTAKSSTSFRVT